MRAQTVDLKSSTGRVLCCSVFRQGGKKLLAKGHARPIRAASVGVLYTDPVSGDRARQLFENFMRQRLERFGVNANFVLACAEDENSVTRLI